jgi:hypothetical protein
MKRSREPEEELRTTDCPTVANSEEKGSTVSQTTHVHVSKITELDESAADESSSLPAMKCLLPGHIEPLVFQSYAEYEVHYAKSHTNRCNECKKNFPSDHLLNIHIEECHDAFAAVLREKGEHTVRNEPYSLSHQANQTRLN